MNKVSFPFKANFIILLVGLFILSCNDDEGIDPRSNLAANNWIYDVMNEVYYWTDEIPTKVNKNLDPIDFFYSLLYPEDRFSAIFPDFDALINSLNGVNREAGYEFMFSRIDEESDDVIGIVIYVKPDSPAKQAGLERGDVIEKINGKSINLSNYAVLAGDLSISHTLTVLKQNEEMGDFDARATINLNVVELSENPNFLDTVYTLEGHKVAYYVYNFFSDGANKLYDDQMDQIFADFKSKGVTDLIVDLRYNSGGSIASATNLASLIGSNVGPGEIFYENIWNDFYQDHWDKEQLIGPFSAKSENIGNNLSRVYILTGTRTASASEMVINGLRPYMDVFTLGDTTVGKNVGSIPIEDEKNQTNHYGMLPIAFKIYNSNKESDYGEGFAPDILVNEFVLPMRALGDVEETLLAAALSHITNAGNVIARAKESQTVGLAPIMSSIDKKVRTNRAILNLNENH